MKVVQNVLTQNFYSKVNLSAATQFRFFTVSDPPSRINTNVDTSQQIDANSDFLMHKMDFSVMRLDGAPVDSLAFAQIGLLVRNTILQITLNSVNVVYTTALASIMTAPIAVAAAGASAYNPTNVLKATVEFPVKLLIRGGQNFAVELLNPLASSLVLLTAQVDAYGVIDRENVVSQGM